MVLCFEKSHPVQLRLSVTTDVLCIILMLLLICILTYLSYRLNTNLQHAFISISMMKNDNNNK